jgi:hypothetical protein
MISQISKWSILQIYNSIAAFIGIQSKTFN